MDEKLVRLSAIVIAVMSISVIAKDFSVDRQWQKSILVFSSGRDHVKGHTDGQIDKFSTSNDMYQCYREPVVVRTNSGRIVVLCHAGNRHAWPERSGQDLASTFSDDGGITWETPEVVDARQPDDSLDAPGPRGITLAADGPRLHLAWLDGGGHMLETFNK